MGEDYISLLNEIREMLSDIKDGQKQILQSVSELMRENKKLHEEIKLNNLVIQGITVKSETLN